MPFKRVRGFPDHLPENQTKRNHIVSTALKTAGRFGFQQVETPIVEEAGVFLRTLGESSSIVNKEMYFLKGEKDLVLRPEGTASTARMLITEKLAPPLKFIYSGPMFRRERPQKGRFRQFATVAVEIFDRETHSADVEALSLAWLFLKNLNLKTKTSLEINTIGDFDERQPYIAKLTEYLTRFKNDLSLESQMRLEKNPLRILDSKQTSDQKLLKEAPSLWDHLSPSARENYAFIKERLMDLSIPFRENPTLVRGLDYYNNLVFEIKSPLLGAQDALLAGGRYDNLVETLGGPSIPAVGWGAGVERLALLCNEVPLPSPEIGLAAVGTSAQNRALQTAHRLREKGFSVFFRGTGGFSKQMKKISKNNCSVALIFGEKEIKNQSITIKNLKTGEQYTSKETELERELVKLCPSPVPSKTEAPQ